MKTLGLILLAVLACGCDVEIERDEVTRGMYEAATKLCAQNGGVSVVRGWVGSKGTRRYFVYCANGMTASQHLE